MVEGGMKCVKYLLFAFNLIFFLAGLGLIIAGIVVQTRFSSYVNFFGNSFPAVAIVLIVIGCIIFVIGFFGCCGAYKEQYCMVMTFAVLLVVIFILEIAAGIAAYALRTKLTNAVEIEMNKAVKNYNKEGSKGVTDTWNILQHDFTCCGVADYTSWKNFSMSNNDSLPDSCCIQNIGGCGVGGYPKGTATLDSSKFYNKGCVKEVENWVKNNIFIVGGIGIGFAFVQIVGIILACCLAKSIRKEYEVV